MSDYDEWGSNPPLLDPEWDDSAVDVPYDFEFSPLPEWGESQLQEPLPVEFYDAPPDWALPEWGSEEPSFEGLPFTDEGFLTGDAAREIAYDMGLDLDELEGRSGPVPEGFESRGFFTDLSDLLNYLGFLPHLDWHVYQFGDGLYELFVDPDTGRR